VQTSAALSSRFADEKLKRNLGVLSAIRGKLIRALCFSEHEFQIAAHSFGSKL
jgi:hypothetical protein